MKKGVLIAMGIILLVCFMLFGFFAFPVGISLCSIIGLVYGVKTKDKQLVKWSLVALVIGVALIVYTLLVINNM